MKRIAFEQGGQTVVLSPIEGARLALSVTLGDEHRSVEEPIPVDQFFRRWPVEGVSVEWAETEDEFVERILKKDAPEGAVIVDEVPADRTFRSAWSVKDGKCVEDVSKAKGVCHDLRRAKRSQEFAPLDVLATVPHLAAEAEAKRQAIRDKHAGIQSAIDSAASVEELRTLANDLG